MRIASFLLVVLIAGCADTRDLAELKKPVLVWERSRGLCGSGRALDGDGRLWLDEGGCEDGQIKWKGRDSASAAQVDALRRAFDALPADTGFVDRSKCSGNVDTFSKIDDAGTTDSWSCASVLSTPLDGLAEPFLTAAMQFLALP